MTSKMPPPPRWGNDELTNFLDTARTNQFSTFANKISETKRIIEIDETFLNVIKEGARAGHLHAPFLLLVRAHSAYRAAASCAFSGQAAELHPLLRLMLEQGGYAFLMFRKPKLQGVWLDRKANASKFKREFTIGKFKGILASSDANLKSAFDELYESALDFGAHPNEMSVTGSLKIDVHEGRETWKVLYLHPDGLMLDHSLRSLTAVGICVLLLFYKILALLFDSSGTSSVLMNYRRALLGPEE